MNILFLVKFYEPFDRGGSEWSTHDLAKLLKKAGHRVTILTPNYGTTSREIRDGILIKRFHFKKLKTKKAEITPWWTNNLIWFVYTSFLCTLHVLKEDIDVIHAQSNEFLPAAVIAGAICQKPTVATFRDYQVICSFGFCLWYSKKACNFSKYLAEDFKFFYENYIQHRSMAKYLVLYLAAIRSYLLAKILFYFATKIKHKVSVSKHLAAIFAQNGIKDLLTIHNPVIVNTSAKKPKDEITYIGKFTKGKGLYLFMESIPQIAKKFPNLKFRFVGAGILENYLKEKTREYELQDRVIFTGRVIHTKAINFAAQSTFVVVPSIWPEPLPRSAAEAILVGTPVVATNVGGIGEIVKNNIYGVLAHPNKDSLRTAITRALQKHNIYRKNIANDLKTLKEHLSSQSVQKYQQIYKSK